MKRLILVLSLLVFFVACDSTDSHSTDQIAVQPAIDIQANGGREYMMADSKVMMRESSEDQKIIRSANLRYEVNDITSSLENIKTLLINYNGVLENERQYTQTDRVNVSLTVNIPAKDFESFIEELLKGESIRRLEERSISAKDVTEQFIDVEARLNTKKQTMSRYQDLLQKAETVSDIINIEDKIRRLQEEIESQEARLDYLKDRVAMAEVRINLYEITESTYVPDKTNAFIPQLLKALDGGLKGIVVIFFWTIRLWPIWIGILIVRLIFKKRNKE